MATKKQVSTVTLSEKDNPSIEEIREWYSKNKNNIERYANAKDALRQLRDTSRS